MRPGYGTVMRRCEKMLLPSQPYPSGNACQRSSNHNARVEEVDVTTRLVMVTGDGVSDSLLSAKPFAGASVD